MPTYAVLAHGDPDMLNRLLLRLAPSPVHLHLDAATDLDRYASTAKLHTHDHVTVLADRVNVRWGGFSAVRAMAGLLNSAAQSAGADDDHIVLLSGQCYPLRPVAEFEQYLADAAWTVHARAYALQEAGEWHRGRVAYRHGFDRTGVLAKRGYPRTARLTRYLYTQACRRTMPRIQPPMDVFAGSQWVALPRQCALDAAAALLGGDFQFMRDSFAPDEMALQTFIYNSHWRELTEMGRPERIGPGASVAALANFHLLDDDLRGSIDRQGLADLPPRAFFARKFEYRRDNELLDHLDRTAQ